MRKEEDFLGIKEIEDDALYGIHSVRAKENFPHAQTFNISWYKAMGDVKYACYKTVQNFYSSANNKYGNEFKKFEKSIRIIEDEKLECLISAALEVSAGKNTEHFICPATQGGAGTSINMNINEIICNRALQKYNKKAGEYNYIDPINDANIFQSTNDVVPTALKLASIRLLEILEKEINLSRAEIEKIENNSRDVLRLGYTQMQSAVPSSFGKLFSSYSEAMSRDWWRVSKCFERIKVVNLGGSAIGTGITVPKYFIMEAAKNLKSFTSLPISRSENLDDATSNLDSFVEVHAILKSSAVNLEKMVSDIRLLSSDIISDNPIKIPERQTGSSIMPGKVNPVICEYIISIAHKIYANDMLVSSLCGQGCLDLNAYLPNIGDALLNSLDLLIAAQKSLREYLLKGLKINSELSIKQVYMSPGISSALIPYIGYNTASELAYTMKNNSINIFEANKINTVIDQSKLEELMQPSSLLETGFSLKQIKTD